MRIRVQVGAVTIDLQGVDMSNRSIRALIDQCAERNAAIEAEPESVEEKPPIGFAAPVLDKAGDPPAEYRFTDDD